MTPDRWIAMLSAIGALLAASFAAWNLYMMRSQRKSAILPIFTLENSIWHTTQPDKADLNKIHGISVFPLNRENRAQGILATNHGRGPAIDTELIFNFNRDCIISKLKSYRDERKLELTKYPSGFMIIKSKAFDGGINLSHTSRSSLGTLAEDAAIEIHLPLDYMIFFSEYLDLVHSHRNSHKLQSELLDDFSSEFSIQLEFSCKDIEGSSHTRIFVVTPVMYSMQNGLEYPKASGSFNIERK